MVDSHPVFPPVTPVKRRGVWASTPVKVLLVNAAWVVLTWHAVLLTYWLLMDGLPAPAYDFKQIVYDPGRHLLHHGWVSPHYPYPLWSVVLTLPFALGTLQTGASLWLLISLLCISVSTVLLTQILAWPQAFAVLLAIAMVTHDRIIAGLLAGQFGVVNLLITVLLLHAVQRGSGALVGFLLAATLIKPHITILVMGGVLSYAVWWKQWRVLQTYAFTTLLLLALSAPFALSPRQIPGGGIANHMTLGIKMGSTVWGLLLMVAPAHWWVPLLVCACLLLWLARQWYCVIRDQALQTNVLELFSTTIAINMLTLPYNWSYNLILLLVPVGYLLQQAMRVQPLARWSTFIIIAVLLYPLSSWLSVAMAPVQNNDVFYTLLPLIILVLLLVYRAVGAGQHFAKSAHF